MLGIKLTKYGWNFNRRIFFGIRSPFQNPFVYRVLPSNTWNIHPAPNKWKWQLGTWTKLMKMEYE